MASSTVGKSRDCVMPGLCKLGYELSKTIRVQDRGRFRGGVGTGTNSHVCKNILRRPGRGTTGNKNAIPTLHQLAALLLAAATNECTTRQSSKFT